MCGIAPLPNLCTTQPQKVGLNKLVVRLHIHLAVLQHIDGRPLHRLQLGWCSCCHLRICNLKLWKLAIGSLAQLPIDLRMSFLHFWPPKAQGNDHPFISQNYLSSNFSTPIRSAFLLQPFLVPPHVPIPILFLNRSSSRHYPMAKTPTLPSTSHISHLLSMPKTYTTCNQTQREDSMLSFVRTSYMAPAPRSKALQSKVLCKHLCPPDLIHGHAP